MTIIAIRMVLTRFLISCLRLLFLLADPPLLALALLVEVDLVPVLLDVEAFVPAPFEVLLPEAAVFFVEVFFLAVVERLEVFFLFFVLLLLILSPEAFLTH